MPPGNFRELLPEVLSGLQGVAALMLLHIGRLPFGKLLPRGQQAFIHARLLRQHMFPRQHFSRLLDRALQRCQKLPRGPVRSLRRRGYPHGSGRVQGGRACLPAVLLQTGHQRPPFGRLASARSLPKRRAGRLCFRAAGAVRFAAQSLM